MNNLLGAPAYSDFQIRAKYFDNQSKWVMNENINYIPYKYFSYKENLGDVLDAGGGTGFLSYYLTKKIPASSITIVDASMNMLQRAKQRIPHAIIINSSIESYCNINSQVFDTILARQIFHYVDDVDKVIVMLKEKLKDSGLLYVGQFVVPDIDSDRWHEEFIKKISKNRKRSFTIDHFLNLFTKNGMCINKLEIVDYEEDIRSFYKRRTNDIFSYKELLEASKRSLNDNVIKNLKIRITDENLFFTVQFCHLILSKK